MTSRRGLDYRSLDEPNYNNYDPCNFLSSFFHFVQVVLITIVIGLATASIVYGIVKDMIIMAVGGGFIILVNLGMLKGAHTAYMIRKEVMNLHSEVSRLGNTTSILQAENVKFSDESKRLGQNVILLENINLNLAKEKTALEKAMGELNSTTLTMQQENQTLKDTNSAFQDQIVELKKTVEKSKEFIKVLVEAGDSYSKFSEKFGADAEKISTLNIDLENTRVDFQKTNEDLKQTASLLHNMTVTLTEHRDRQIARGLTTKNKKKSAPVYEIPE